MSHNDVVLSPAETERVLGQNAEMRRLLAEHNGAAWHPGSRGESVLSVVAQAATVTGMDVLSKRLSVQRIGPDQSPEG